MKGKKLILVGVVVTLLLLTAQLVLADGRGHSGHNPIQRLRAVTARFRSIPAAQAAGYDLVPGLDHCFDNPGVGGMGYHYINLDILDLNVDPLRPEAMVYSTGQNGRLQLGAVEYVVPAAAWDAAGHSEPPQLFGHHFHFNESLGVYALHAWIWKHNPAGMFEDWNPNVTCP
ncbi:hypothetical protein [Candidatus Leptofilum sp.]|uniref:hypothetical protein n=1 Tax=Candidatus Leptofilum sp. TaxID=3241576 RepID=UPI003B5B164A